MRIFTSHFTHSEAQFDSLPTNNNSLLLKYKHNFVVSYKILTCAMWSTIPAIQHQQDVNFIVCFLIPTENRTHHRGSSCIITTTTTDVICIYNPKY